MTDWDLVIVANKLKEKQTAMQKSHTEIVDALNGLGDELALLAGVWKGQAEEEFLTSFVGEWEEAYRLSEKIGKLIAAYTMVESAFENCESSVTEII